MATIYDIIIRAVDNAKGVLNGTSQQLDKLDKQTALVNTGISKLNNGVTRFAQAGAVAFSALTVRAIAYADTINDTADATDISVQSILALQQAAIGSAVNIGDISNALLRFNENLGTAASSGGKQLRDALSQVGISLTELETLSSDQLLSEAIQGLANIEDKSKAAALQTDIFGKGLRGLPLSELKSGLQQSAEAQLKQAQAIQRSAVLADNYERAMNSLSMAILEGISPAVDFINTLSESEGAINRVIDILKILGVVIATVFAFTALGAAVRIIGTIGRGFVALIGIIKNVGSAFTLSMFNPMSKFMQLLRGVGGLVAGIFGGKAAYDSLFGDDDKKKTPTTSDKKPLPPPTPFPGRKIEKLSGDKSDVQKVRNVLATAAESFAEANSAYDQLINVFEKTPNLSLQALQFQELARAAETLGIVVQKPAALIERDFSLALRKSGEELRINAEQLKMTASMQIKFAQEITGANLALEERRLKLADAAYQQGLFNNSIESNRLTQQEQISTLAKANTALNAGTISLSEYGKIVTGIAPELLTLADKQRLLKDEFGKELKVQKDTDLLAIYRVELARASGDVRAFVDAYSQYKSIFGATAEGELALALKGAREDIKLTDERKKAYGDLSDQLKAGAISGREFRAAASTLGIDEGAASRAAAIYGSFTDQVVFNNEMLEKSINKLASTFENDLTTAIMSGKNIFSSFKDFVGGILNDIASQIIQQSISGPLANALSGLAKSIGGSIFGSVGGASGGASAGSNLFGSIGSAIGKFFAGGFAEGGVIGSGKIGLVGENGPELISGPAGITPLDQMSGGGGDTFNVNFNISAIDTQSGAEFIMRNKPIITSVIEQAYNKRGRRGPVTIG